MAVSLVQQPEDLYFAEPCPRSSHSGAAGAGLVHVLSSILSLGPALDLVYSAVLCAHSARPRYSAAT